MRRTFPWPRIKVDAARATGASRGALRPLGLSLLCASLLPCALAQSAPTIAQRQQAMRTLVQVTAQRCPDGLDRSGTGFALEQAGRLVTAHHVVGGCQQITVSYDAAPSSSSKLYTARLARVYSTGDLALLQVDQPPTVPALRLIQGAVPRDTTYVGLGYALGMPTATDIDVRFSAGPPRLKDILPAGLADELRRAGSAIATDREVLRFQSALQPGMSGGPIVNAVGEVIGVVAGGLKAGAAPASWGWPGDWIRLLVASNEPLNLPVRAVGSYYSQSEMAQLATARRTGRRLQCGQLEFVDTGERSFAELARGADDAARLQYIMALSRAPLAELEGLRFQVWVHQASGATAVLPAGLQLKREGGGCVAHSSDGQFQAVVWGAPVSSRKEVQDQSVSFEQQMMAPRVPSIPGVAFDPQLTTLVMHPQTGAPIPGPQLRPNGLVFNRKGFQHPLRPLQFPGDLVPYAHSFETLVALGGAFLGVGMVNGEVDSSLNTCIGTNSLQTPPCTAANAHLRQWTHFVLATQLSTFPSL